MKKSYKKKIAIALAVHLPLSGNASAVDINKCQNSKMITSAKQNGRFLDWWENRSKIQKLGILGGLAATLATVVITTACLLKNKNNKDNEKNIPENNKENNDVISDAKNSNLINKSQNSNKNQNFKKENNGENKQNNGNILDNQPKNMQERLKQNLNEYNKINIINIKQQEQPKIIKKINENILKMMNTKIDSCIKKQRNKANEDTYIYDSLGGKSYSELVKIVAEMIINGCLEDKFEKLKFTDGRIATKIGDYKQNLDNLLKHFIDIFDDKINLDNKCVKFSYIGGCKFTFIVPGEQENELTLVIKNGSPPPNNNREYDNLFSSFYGNGEGSFLVELSSTLQKSEDKINCIRFRIGPKSMAEWKV